MNVRDQVQDRMAAHILQRLDTILLVSIRMGKTRVAIKAIEPGDRVLIVYPLVEIRKTWETELSIFPAASTNITFTTTKGLHKYAGQYFDYVIVDEPQLCQSVKQLTILRTIRYRKRVGLSGVLRNKTKKKLSTLLNWRIGLTYTLADAIRDRMVKDYEIFVHYVDLDDQRPTAYEYFGQTRSATEKGIYEFYTSQMTEAEDKQIQAIANNDPGEIGKWKAIYQKYMGLRTNFLYNSPTLFNYTRRLISGFRDEKLLIYTLRTDIADLLSTDTFHSKNREDDILDEFKESDSGHMAVVNCIQAGVTIRHLHKVVFHSYESNTEKFHQKLGRSLLYEFEGQMSQIHVVCLKGTQMEHWVENACQSLEQQKIRYVFNGIVYNKLAWIKHLHPDKNLFIYDGAIVYFSHTEVGMGGVPYKHYRFISNPDKAYALPFAKLQPI